MRPGTSARFGRVGVLGHSPDQSQWHAARRVCRGTLSRRDAAGFLPKHRLKVRTRGQGGAPTISGGEMAAPNQRIRIRDSPKRFRRRYIHRVSHEPPTAMVTLVRKNDLRAPIVHGSRRAPYGQNTIWFGLNPYGLTILQVNPGAGPTDGLVQKMGRFPWQELDEVGDLGRFPVKKRRRFFLLLAC